MQGYAMMTKPLGAVYRRTKPEIAQGYADQVTDDYSSLLR